VESMGAVRSNGGAAGVDEITLRSIEEQGVAPISRRDTGRPEGKRISPLTGEAAIHTES